MKEQGLSVILAASDTFRAAAIDQLQVHADKLGVKLIITILRNDLNNLDYPFLKDLYSDFKDKVIVAI